MSGSTAQNADNSATVVVYDDRPLPSLCVICGAPATSHVERPYSLREPTYRLMLYTGVGMGLFIATWMMVKVRPNITHELPAALSFTLLFLATFLPVWIVASLTSRHQGTLRLPVCDAHPDPAEVLLASEGDERLSLSPVAPAFAAAAGNDPRGHASAP